MSQSFSEMSLTSSLDSAARLTVLDRIEVKLIRRSCEVGALTVAVDTTCDNGVLLRNLGKANRLQEGQNQPSPGGYQVIGCHDRTRCASKSFSTSEVKAVPVLESLQ